MRERGANMQLSTFIEKLDTQTAVSGYMTYAGCVNAGDQVLFRSNLEKPGFIQKLFGCSL